MTSAHIDPQHPYYAANFAPKQTARPAKDLFDGRTDGDDSAWSAWCRTIDYMTVIACFVLFSIGVLLSFAASPTLAEDNGLPPFHYAWRHFLFGAPAFAALFMCSFLDETYVRRAGAIGALVGIAVLATMPWYGVSFGKGAVRWVSGGGFSAQPSEFVKPFLVIACAWMLSGFSNKDRRISISCAVASFATAAIVVGLLIMQPDYGQATLILAVWAAMFYVAGAPIGLLLVLFGMASVIGVAAYLAEPHIANRIEAFLDPGAAVGRQIQIAQEAILSGGWTGRGLGEGLAKITLPDAHTDFILAVAAEEYGFVMAFGVVALFGYIVVRALMRLRASSDGFVLLAGVGLALLVGLQAFVNLGVAVQILPAKGMTLPFISYGGSSMVATGATMGLLLALTRRRPQDLSNLVHR